MTVKIYLRSIVHNGKQCLAMFDSERNGDINNLITGAHAGDKLIWRPDSCSGIKSIIKIYSKEEERIIFESDPQKQWLCRGFEFIIPKSVKEGVVEGYTIEYLLRDDTKCILDPYIKILPPPPTKGTT